jgi:hypothetical protein
LTKASLRCRGHRGSGVDSNHPLASRLGVYCREALVVRDLNQREHEPQVPGGRVSRTVTSLVSTLRPARPSRRACARRARALPGDGTMEKFRNDRQHHGCPPERTIDPLLDPGTP